MTVAIVVMTALLLAPGVGAALVFAPPGELRIESRLALAFGLGYALVAGVATVLALAHVFSRPTFVAGVFLATVTVWLLAQRRAGLRAHGSALVAEAREAPFALGAGLALLAAVGITRSLYPPGISLGIRSAWRYWADGLEVAYAGHVPAQTHQWGIEFPTTVSKVVLNAFEGGVSYVLGPTPLPAMQGILVVTMIGLVAALLAVGRELGLGIFAPLVPVLVVLVPDGVPLSHEISQDMKWYTAEDMGRMVGFCALVAGIQMVRGPERRWRAVVTGLLLTVAALTHLIPAVIAGALIALYALVVHVRERGGFRRMAAAAAVTAGVFVGCYVGTLGLSGGDLGFQAAGGASFSAFPAHVDPTRSFSRGKLTPRGQKHNHFLFSPQAIAKRYAGQAVGSVRGTGVLGVALLALLAAATAIFVYLAPRLIPLAVLPWGLLAVLLVVSLLFSFRYGTRIPADFGTRRLSGYVVLVPALAAPAFLEALAARFLPRALAVAALSVLVGAIAVGVAVVRIPNRTYPQARAGLAVAERVAEVVSCDARMLANGRTAGFWEATTGRRAVTEGHAPFLRPEVLSRVLPTLIGANEFFADPSANRAFLTRERVQYVVVVEPGAWFGTSGYRAPEEGDAQRVGALPGVHLVSRAPHVSIFRVGGAMPGGEQPRRCPV